MVAAREHTLRHLLLAAELLDALDADTHPSGTLSLSPNLFPLLCFLSLSARAELAAAVRCRRSLRAPLASPTCPRASPRLPRPPCPATPRQRPCIDAIFIIFVVGRWRSLSPPRSLRCFPEHAKATSALAVSSSTDSPLSHVH